MYTNILLMTYPSFDLDLEASEQTVYHSQLMQPHCKVLYIPPSSCRWSFINIVQCTVYKVNKFQCEHRCVLLYWQRNGPMVEEYDCMSKWCGILMVPLKIGGI